MTLDILFIAILTFSIGCLIYAWTTLDKVERLEKEMKDIMRLLKMCDRR